MASRNVDVSVRYVLQTVDRGLRQAVGLTKDFSNVTKSTSRQVDASLRANSRAWQDTARIAGRAQRQVAQETASAGTKVDRSLERQVVALRKAGVQYKDIAAASRGWGRTAAETSAAIERSAAKEVQAIDRIAAARKRLKRAMTLGISGGGGGGGAGLGREERSLERGVLGAASSRARLGASSLGGGLVAGVAGYLGISAIKDAAQGTAELAKQAEQLHAYAGLSRQTGAEFVAVADAYGVSVTKLGMTFRTLGSAVTTQLTKPTATTKQEFKALGITTEELRKHQGDLQALLGLVADRLNKMPAGAQKTTIASKLLGRSWQTLAPLLETGSKGMDDQLASAKALGVELGGNSTKNALKLHEATIELKIAQKGLEVQFTEHVLPALLKGAEFGIKLYGVLRKELGPAFHFVTGEVKAAGHWLSEHKTVLHGVEIAAAAATTAFVGLKVIGLVGRIARGVYADYKSLTSGIKAVVGLFSRQESESAQLIKAQTALAEANAKLAASYDGVAASARAAAGSEVAAAEAGGAGGVILPPGTSAAREAEVAATNAELTTAETGALATGGAAGASRFAGLGGKLLKGAGIAGGGFLATSLLSPVLSRALGLGAQGSSALSGIGKGASIGAGLGSVIPGVGTVLGGLGGAAIGGIVSQLGGKSVLGTAQQTQAFKRAIAQGKSWGDALQAGEKQMAAERSAQQLMVTIQKKINTASAGTVQSLQKRLDAAKKDGALTDKQARAAQRVLNARGGQIVGRRLGSTFQDIATSKYAPNATQIFQRTTQDLAGLPKHLQDLGSEAMVKFAAGLEAKKKLPKGTTDELIKDLQSVYGPQLTRMLQRDGNDSMKAISDAIKQSKVVGTVQDQVDAIHKKWKAVIPQTKVTTGNLVDVVSADMARLRGIIANSTGKQHDDAVRAYKALQRDSQHTLGAMVTTLSGQQANLQKSIAQHSNSARKAATTNFFQMAKQIAGAVASGVEATGTGITQISTALESTLKAFGASKVPGVLSVGKAVVNSAKAIQNFVNPPKHAGGGRVPGAVGPDNWMLVDPSGRPAAMVGGSEILVANRHTEARVDGMLSYFGTSLDREVARETRMHSFASGGRATRRATTGGSFAAPATGGGSVIDLHSGDMTQGQEPQILSDLYRLSRELRQSVYIISGYRTPAHSVAVGGFADDPHTRGEAADIGIGSPSRDSMFGVSESQLRAVGLYRPFYPPSASEVNHVQLLAGGARGAGSIGVGGGPVSVPKIKVPDVKGQGTIPNLVRAGLKKMVDAANAKAQKAAGAAGSGGFTGTLSGPVPRQVYQFMSANGFNKIAIAGMLGNAMQESSMNPQTPGGGLWQQISNFGSGTGGSLLNQMQTMLPQIVGLRSSMNAAGSPGQAAVLFEQGFERAGIPAMSNRIAAANAAYAAGYARGGRVDPPGTAGSARKAAIAAIRGINAPIKYATPSKSSTAGTSNLKAQSAFRVNASSETNGGQGAFGFSPGVKSGGRGYSILSGTGLSSDPGPYGIALGPGKWQPPSPLIFKRGSRRATGTLQDIGAGDNSRPTIGLYPTTIRDLGGTYNSDLSGVEIERADGHKFTALRAVAVKPFRLGGWLGLARHGRRVLRASVPTDRLRKHPRRGGPDFPYGIAYRGMRPPPFFDPIIPGPSRGYSIPEGLAGAIRPVDWFLHPMDDYEQLTGLRQIFAETPILTSPHDYGRGHRHPGRVLAQHIRKFGHEIRTSLSTIDRTESPARFKLALVNLGKELGHVDAVSFNHITNVQARLRRQIRETSAFKHPDRIKDLEAELAKTKKGTADAKRLAGELKTARESFAEERKLQAALKVADDAAGKRISLLVRHAEAQASALQGASTRLGRIMTRRAIDSASRQGSEMLLRFDNHSVNVMRNTVESLRKAEHLARRAHDPKKAAAIRAQLKAALDNLDQGVTDRMAARMAVVTNTVAQIAQKTQDRSTTLQAAQALASTPGLQGAARALGATIGLHGKVAAAGTAAAARESISVSRRNVSQLGDELEHLQKRLADTTDAGMRKTIKAAISQTGQALAQAAGDLRTAIEDAAQQSVDLASHHTNLTEAHLQHLQLSQELAGTSGSAGGARQIAQYIRAQVIPALQEERDALQKQEAAAKRAGDTALARQIAEAIAAKNNDIESEKVDALNAIKAATQATAQNTAELGGTLGVQYGSDQLPDLASMLVGA